MEVHSECGNTNPSYSKHLSSLQIEQRSLVSNALPFNIYYYFVLIKLVLYLFVIFLFDTIDPLRLRTGVMVFLKCFSTILCMLFTYKPST
jgi:hypothetical protein